MSTSTMTLATRPTFRSLQRFFFTTKGLLLLVLALLAALSAVPAGIETALPRVVAAAAGAAALDIVLARIIRGIWFFLSGALLSGMIVAMILGATEPLPVVIATAMLAVNAKYLFRARERHIFNPAALALVAAYFLFASGQSWWGALPNLPLPAIAILAATGFFIVDRVNKMPMVLTFLGGYFLLFTLAGFGLSPAHVAEVFRTPDLQAALFFAFFMLTDPPTSPARYRDQVWYGLIVAGASVAIYLTLGGLYFLPAGLLIGNAWEAWRRVTARTRTAAQRR